MRLRRPRPASPDEVRTTREGDTAVIEYASPSVRGVHLRLGPALAAMTDAEVLERFKAMLEAQAERAASVDRTLVEVPPGRPQIAYYERGDQWWGVSDSLSHLGGIEEQRGELDRAYERYAEALEIRQRLAEELGTPQSRQDVAELEDKVEQAVKALTTGASQD